MGELIDLGFSPRLHQREAHERRKRFSVLVWHRRAGKTVWAILELILAAIVCARTAPRYAYVAPYFRQGKSVAWDYLRRFALRIPGASANETELSVRLPNGAVIRIFGADNPDSLRGLYFDGVVLDEVADMRPQVWGEIIRPALADREGWAVFIGTPKGTNLFSEVYYGALQDPAWYPDLRRAADTDAIPAEELARMRTEMSDPQWAQEMDCDFSAAVENALIKLEDVLAAQERDVERGEVSQFAKILGVDVARYGGDRSVVVMRQGRVAWEPAVYRSLDLMTLAGQVALLADKHGPDAIFVDQGGIGAGVLDRLRQLGLRQAVGVDFGGKPLDGRFENRRAEMWWLMAEWVRTASLPRGTDLATDLTAPTYSYANRRGRMELESKDDMRERGLPSPDIADALALTFAAPVQRHSPEHAMAERGRVAADYQPGIG